LKKFFLSVYLRRCRHLFLHETANNRRTSKESRVTVMTPANRPAMRAPMSRSDRMLVALLGYRTMAWEGSENDTHSENDAAAIERDRTRDRIRLVHSVMARRRLRALGGRRLP
jgi:hypothetical protein